MEVKKIKASQYPICPMCGRQSIVGANMTESKKLSIYCSSAKCNYDIPFEKLTSPVPIKRFKKFIIKGKTNGKRNLQIITKLLTQHQR